MRILEETTSICPSCFKENKINKINAEIIEDQNKVWIVKKCDNHGSFKEIYFDDINFYNKCMNYKIDSEIVSDVKTKVFDGPRLYSNHISKCVLTNLFVTNRCNLNCSHCHLKCESSNFIYEPSLNQIRQLLLQTKNQRPNGCNAIQIVGGEPTIRDDLFVIIRMAKEVGFSYVSINTNGIKLAENINYCKRLKDERVDTVYLNFNGVSNKTNPYLDKCKTAIENLRNADIKVALSSIIIKNKNLGEVGKIIRFALENMDVIRGVIFQPICFCGNLIDISDERRKEQQVDYIQIISEIEKEFDNEISWQDFYPPSYAYSLSKLIDTNKGGDQFAITSHPGCGVTTYLFYEDNKPIPITRFIDIPGLMSFIEKQSETKGPLKKIRIGASLYRHIFDFVDEEKKPTGLNLKKMLTDVAVWSNEDLFRAFQFKSLFVGINWYQDCYNLNIDRLKRCMIFNTTLEGMIPFCSYNGLGIGHKIRKKYSMPINDLKNNPK